jgi:hypothetical protein
MLEFQAKKSNQQNASTDENERKRNAHEKFRLDECSVTHYDKARRPIRNNQSNQVGNYITLGIHQ